MSCWKIVFAFSFNNFLILLPPSLFLLLFSILSRQTCRNFFTTISIFDLLSSCLFIHPFYIAISSRLPRSSCDKFLFLLVPVFSLVFVFFYRYLHCVVFSIAMLKDSYSFSLNGLSMIFFPSSLFFLLTLISRRQFFVIFFLQCSSLLLLVVSCRCLYFFTIFLSSITVPFLFHFLWSFFDRFLLIFVRSFISYIFVRSLIFHYYCHLFSSLIFFYKFIWFCTFYLNIFFLNISLLEYKTIFFYFLFSSLLSLLFSYFFYRQR